MLKPLPEERVEAREALSWRYSRAQETPQSRQMHLDTFFTARPAKGVWRLVYDEDGSKAAKYARQLVQFHGCGVRMTDAPDGPGFLVDALPDRQKNEWRYRTHKTRPIFITPVAYERNEKEFENVMVDRLYWRARDLWGAPMLPWRDVARATRGECEPKTPVRVARDLTHHLDEQTYLLLSDAHVIMHQVRGGIARGIATSPTVRAAAQELNSIATVLAHASAKTRYGRFLLDRSLREMRGYSP